MRVNHDAPSIRQPAFDLISAFPCHFAAKLLEAPEGRRSPMADCFTARNERGRVATMFEVYDEAAALVSTL